MIKVIRQFEEYDKKENEVTVFLAGGITNAYDWQSRVIEELIQLDFQDRDTIKNKYTLVIFNPREEGLIEDTKYTSMNDKIFWDCTYLDKADIIGFNFASGEASQTSSQFELGYYIAKYIYLYGLDIGERLHIKDLYMHLLINIEPGYNHEDKLCAYLKYLLYKEYNDIVSKQSPEKFAKLIYEAYKLYIF